MDLYSVWLWHILWSYCIYGRLYNKLTNSPLLHIFIQRNVQITIPSEIFSKRNPISWLHSLHFHFIHSFYFMETEILTFAPVRKAWKNVASKTTIDMKMCLCVNTLYTSCHIKRTIVVILTKKFL